MKRLLLVFGILQASLPVVAAEVAVAPVLPDSYVSPFGSYQSWSEPTVQDWQETHRQVTEEVSAHADHQGMSMPDMPEMNHEHMNHKGMNMPDMPDQPTASPKPNHQPVPNPKMKVMPKMNHESMNHKGMNMPSMSHDPKTPASSGGKAQ